MPKLIKTCPDIDIEDSSDTNSLYQEYLSSPADFGGLETQASQELNLRLIEEFGSTDYLNALTTMSENPSNYEDGRWGFSHAGLSILKLETLRLAGGSSSEITTLANNEIAYWYSREAIARCNDTIEDWMNPLMWSEDSRLDYMTPKLFIDWYLLQL